MRSTQTWFVIGTLSVACWGLLESPVHAQSGEEALAAYNNGLKLYQQKKYDDALTELKKALGLFQKLQGEDGVDVAHCCLALGNVHVAKGYQLGVAWSYFDQSRVIFVRTKNYREALTVLNNLAGLLRASNNADGALQYHRFSINILEKMVAKDPPDAAKLLFDLAELYHVTGQQPKAEPLYQRSLKLAEQRKEHDLVIRILGQQATLYRQMHQYAKAESICLHWLEMCEAKFGKDQLVTADPMHSLAMLYSSMAQFDKADQLFRRSLAIREAKLGKDHPLVASSLMSLADLHEDKEEYAEAEPLYERALGIFEVSKDRRYMAVALLNLGRLYTATGQYAKAEQMLQRAREMCSAQYGYDHPQMASALEEVGRLYSKMGQYDKATRVYISARNIYVAQAGKDNLRIATNRLNLACNFALHKEWPDARECTDESRGYLSDYFAQVLPTLSEQEQLALVKRWNADFHVALSIGWSAPKEARAAADGAEWLLNGKAIAHESLAEQHLLARDAKDPKARQLVADLQETRGRLAALVHRTPLPGKEKAYQQEMQELKTAEQELSQKLARVVGRPLLAKQRVGLSEVRTRLGHNTAFVDIARFAVFDFAGNKKAGTRYVAWITPPLGKGDVQLIDLGAAEPIDQLVDQTRRALLESAKSVTKVGEIEAMAALQKPLKELSAKVLHPLLPTLEKYEEWIVCPDGALWLTPWNALLLPDGKFAVEKHLVRHVVSGRDLVLELPKTKTRSAYIFADPDYDLSPGNVMKLAGVQLQAEKHASRSAGSVHGTLPRVDRLEGTAMEAEAICPKLQQWLGEEPKVFLGGQASETLVKAVKNPRVLNLATHGYFLPSQELRSTDRPDRQFDESKRSVALFDTKGEPIENPLLRCGLLFAGCNERSQAKPGEDDGILTGLEIVGMDLNGCELVVLSACETGLGDVRSGEGVAGLRQAFQLAGAKGVLASLWQVPDRETALLMNTFYGELAKGRTQAASMREAQLQRIASRRTQFGAAHPFFWAAFALTSRGE